MFLYATHQVLEKSDVNRPVGCGIERHFCLIGRSVAFLYIAFVAGGHQIFPCILPAATFRHYVIQSEVRLNPAVLANVPVSFHDIFARQYNSGIGNSNIISKSNYGWIGKLLINCTYHLFRIFMKHLRLFEK